MHRLLQILLLFVAALAMPTTSWAASTSANLAINVTAAQAITGVSLSSNSFTGGAPSGTVVGAISVTMSPSSPAFSGSLSLSGSNVSSFQIVGSNLETNGAVPAGTYNINIVATEAGLTGSPFTRAETVTGTDSANGGGVTFAPLHTYYMSPTGSDSNNGTSSSTPWASPNHNLVCGDVIIAAPGAYSNQRFTSAWGTVSNCPSTSGGIDGTGGVYFATILCGGSYVGACTINGGSGDAVDVVSSNWAMEGWQATSSGGRSFQVYACASGTTILHHIAFVNDISANSNQGYDTNECALNHNVPGNGVDYFAVVGSIAQNSANDPICLGAIDVVAPANYDLSAGTHIFFGGDFAIANREQSGCSDGEGIMFDTWDAHGYTGQGVIEQSVSVGSGRYGLQLFDQFINPSSPHIYVFNNTFFDNFYNTGSDYSDGEINWQPTQSNSPWIVNIYNNIARTRIATSPSGTPLYAFQMGNPVSNTTIGGSDVQNIFKGLQTNCAGSSCDFGDNVTAFNGASFGTNTYLDPSFTNTSDLTANRYGTPNCSSFPTVTACMGWNQSTLSVTTPSVISDLTPTASGMTGKGYQPPSACTPDPYYPTWLKGIVYLQWNGSSITENAGLLIKPCGL